MNRSLVTCAALAVTTWVAGCGDPGCLHGNDTSCTVPAACEAVAFTCDGGAVEVRQLESIDGLPLTDESTAAPGDFLLSNGNVWVIIDAVDHPHYLTETGGSIVDMGTWDGSRESLPQVFQVAGLLPGEAPIYTDIRIIDDGENKAIQATGHLAGNEDLYIATRYEMGPCDPGVRVRTELVNRSPNPQSWMLLDAWWWGGRGHLAFSPSDGGGFTWPDWGLLTLADGLRAAPYLGGGLQGADSVSYAEVPCDRREAVGLHSTYVSGYGLDRFVAMPRDYETFDRFIVAAPGRSTSSAVDAVMEIRRQLWAEDYVTVTGRIMADGVPVVGDGLRASVVLSEGTVAQADTERRPVTQVLPDADGYWSARVPAQIDLVVSVDAFGQRVADVDAAVGADDVDVGEVAIPPLGELTLSVLLDGAPAEGLVFVVPADPTTDAATRGRFYGHFEECAPLLGSPNGGSPSCNRIMVDGPTTTQVPPGNYDLYVTSGLFSSMGARRGVTITAGEETTVTLPVTALDLQPAGTLSSDFHVHGAASWDSTVPEYDRSLAFLAARMDVIVSTEHNATWNYAAAIDALGAADRLQLINGSENTGLVLFDVVPDTLVPKVAGHWNFWPVPFDRSGPYLGAWWDQDALPGELFTRAAAGGWSPETGIAQLNHPTSELLVGRDFGWADAIGLDVTRPLVTEYDGTGHSLFGSTPAGSAFANSDFDTTEVMNGTDNSMFMGYRAVWWWMLNQGLLRAGTANSDSHTIGRNIVGTPRTLVWTDQEVGPDFDTAVFNESVRDGRMIGTNGPVVTVSTTDPAGDTHTSSLTPFVPAADAALDITVRAAPWVPVDEIRVIVDGVVVQTITEGIAHPADPMSADAADLDRFHGTVSLAGLLPASGDAWVVVEAGTALPHIADLNCDGLPDTGDTNGDGTIDWQDVDGIDAAPDDTACLDTVGPQPAPMAPDRDTPLWFFQVVTPNGYPASYTNPLVFDLDGDGQFTGVTQ